jgi:hypothetical protein
MTKGNTICPQPFYGGGIKTSDTSEIYKVTSLHLVDEKYHKAKKNVT